MNNYDIYLDSKKHVQNLHNYLAAIFKETFNIPAQAGEAKLLREFKIIKNFGLIRFNAKKSSYLFGLGCSNEKHYKVYEKLRASLGDSEAVANFEKKLFKGWMDLINAIYQANQIQIDPKQSFVIQGPDVGPWGQIECQEFYQLPINLSLPDGMVQLLIDVPLFNQKTHDYKTFEFFGLSFDSRILVVDDTAIGRKVGRHFLSLAGLGNHEEAEDGGQAYAKLTTSTPQFDLVIADWHMPIMSGIDLLKKIRSNPQIGKIPVVLATGEQKVEEVKRAIKEGVSGYCVKPFTAPTLYTAINKAMISNKKAA